MKKPLPITIPILLLGALPALALASGDQADGHDIEGMAQGEHGGAAGRPGDPAKVGRTIDVTMDDTPRFNPDRIDVKAGETVRFFVKNTGKTPHEMVLGSMAELKAHAAMMRSMPTMQHSNPGMLRLESGKIGAIVWQFDKPGAVDFACLVPGHMEAGMVGKIVAQ